MARQKLDKETRKALLNARKMIEAVAKADGNESETRRRVERIFESLMGYDVLKHITRNVRFMGLVALNIATSLSNLMAKSHQYL